MDFKQFLSEEKHDTIAVLNGRMTPVTKGHEENVNGLKKLAKEHNADHLVIATHSHDTKTEGSANKNPLSPAQKEKHLHRAFPNTNIQMTSKEKPSIFHHLSDLHKKGYKHVVLASGADRTEDYERVKKYNGVKGSHGYYKFKSIKTASTGERKEGVSGTDMRKHAASGNFEKFREGLASKLAGNEKHAKDIYNDVRHGMHIKEDYENPNRFDWGTPEGTNHAMNMTPGMEPEKIVCPVGETWSKGKGTCVPIREAYIANEIFNLGSIVEATDGVAGEIVYRGSSYVTIQLENGETTKRWLKDVKESTKEIIIGKRKIKENVSPARKIPALLMSKEQLAEMTRGNMEIEYMGYKTSNLHMSADASETLKQLTRRNDVNPKFVMQAIKATDDYLQIQKDASNEGFAKEETVHSFVNMVAIAHDTLNMLGVSDQELVYMNDNLKAMSDLSMHRDGSFANEPYVAVPVAGLGDIEEGVDSSDYRIVVDSLGRKRRVRANRIITDKETDKDTEMKESKLNLSSFREKIKVEEQTVDPKSLDAIESPTHARDINFRGEKDVFHGIDKPIEGQDVDGKQLGMVSFKSFMNAPETQKVAAEHAKDRQDVHRAQVELAQSHSPAYKQMSKAARQDV